METKASGPSFWVERRIVRLGQDTPVARDGSH